MNCPTCGSPNPAEARFCMSCGTRLPASPESATAGTETSTTITNLRRLVPREYADRLLAAGGRARGERRVVTILFLDVAGSTAMSEKLDPEDVMEIMNGAFETLIKPILRYGGTLARLTGDGVLAFFGAPVAHEDDADRACHAALEIVEAARAYGELLRARRGIEGFNVRVGLNTGLVVVGEVGSDLRVEYTAMGDAVNLAARMEAMAEPGTVLVTAHTRELARAAFDFDDMGPRQVKGKEEPVPTHRLTGRRVSPREDTLASALVGRSRELERICAAADAVVAGRGGVLAVTGEPGVGKTRLVAETRELRPHAEWVGASCESYAQSSSYQVVRQLVFKLMGVDRELSPEAMMLIDSGRGDTLPALTPAQARERMVDILHDCLMARAAEGPLVVVVDDVQWADQSSLEVIAEVLPVADEAPVLFILVYRPGVETLDTFAHALRERGDAQLQVQPLGGSGAAQLLDSLLQGHDLPAPARMLILQAAEGNPYFIHQVVHSIIELGLAEEALAGGLPHVSNMTVPTTVQGAIMARLDRLPLGDRRILQAAAVIGRLFEVDLLADTLSAEMDRDALEHRLESLAAHGFVHPAPTPAFASVHVAADRHTAPYSRHFVDRSRAAEGAAYIFRDPMTTEVCYKSLLKRERQAMHARVGEAMERRCAEGTGSCGAAVLAYHFDKAGDVTRAMDYLQKAAAHSRAIGAEREAEAFERRAHELTESGRP
jgi:class 3 adenylate cyclase